VLDQRDLAAPSQGSRPVERRIAALIGFEATTLAVMSGLHLGGVLGGGSEPYNPSRAGIAEAVICLVLAAGAVALARNTAHARRVAVVATGFAIAGFVLGLSFTIRGGHAADVAYHAAVLPLLVLTLVVLVRASDRPSRSRPVGAEAASPRE
jgi:hypothetical protein